jgi:hypothetical protein
MEHAPELALKTTRPAVPPILEKFKPHPLPAKRAGGGFAMPAPTPETITLARQRYVEGLEISKILAETGISLGTLYLWLDGGPIRSKTPRLPRIERRNAALGKRRRALKGDRVSLVNRLWRTAERQVRDIEERLRLNEQKQDERERDARMLAVLVKTVRELRALGDANDEAKPENDVSSESLDDYRAHLARKIDAIVASRSAGAAGE